MTTNTKTKRLYSGIDEAVKAEERLRELDEFARIVLPHYLSIREPKQAVEQAYNTAELVVTERKRRLEAIESELREESGQARKNPTE